MTELEARVANAAGIHCRPSARIVEGVREYPGTLRLLSGDQTTDLRSVLGLMSLGLEQGARLRIQVSGPDEAAECRRLVALFETRFDFPPRTDSAGRPLAAR